MYFAICMNKDLIWFDFAINIKAERPFQISYTHESRKSLNGTASVAGLLRKYNNLQ